MPGCIQPMSSPMMNRMFGFFCWAEAGDADASKRSASGNTKKAMDRFIAGLPR